MEDRKKQAILILAHRNTLALKSTIELLDSQYFDFFLHIDKKSKIQDFFYLKKITKFSTIHFSERKNVHWGGFSMVEAMFALLECARDTGEYSYFHFLSGDDMPIKDNEIVFNFFENSYPQNFIDILDFENVNKNSYFYEPPEMIEERVKYYYPHMDILNRKGTNFIGKKLIYLQKLLKVNRLKNREIEIFKGHQWCSLTNQFVDILLDKEERRVGKSYFSSSLIPDECYFQTFAMIKKVEIYQQKNMSARLIDWTRGKPYIWRQDDFFEIMNDKDSMFSRKFDENVDRKIIEEIYIKIRGRSTDEANKINDKRSTK